MMESIEFILIIPSRGRMWWKNDERKNMNAGSLKNMFLDYFLSYVTRYILVPLKLKNNELISGV